MALRAPVLIRSEILEDVNNVFHDIDENTLEIYFLNHLKQIENFSLTKNSEKKTQHVLKNNRIVLNDSSHISTGLRDYAKNDLVDCIPIHEVLKTSTFSNIDGLYSNNIDLFNSVMSHMLSCTLLYLLRRNSKWKSKSWKTCLEKLILLTNQRFDLTSLTFSRKTKKWTLLSLLKHLHSLYHYHEYDIDFLNIFYKADHCILTNDILDIFHCIKSLEKEFLLPKCSSYHKSYYYDCLIKSGSLKDKLFISKFLRLETPLSVISKNTIILNLEESSRMSVFNAFLQLHSLQTLPFKDFKAFSTMVVLLFRKYNKNSKVYNYMIPMNTSHNTLGLASYFLLIYGIYLYFLEILRLNLDIQSLFNVMVYKSYKRKLLQHFIADVSHFLKSVASHLTDNHRVAHHTDIEEQTNSFLGKKLPNPSPVSSSSNDISCLRIISNNIALKNEHHLKVLTSSEIITGKSEAENIKNIATMKTNTEIRSKENLSKHTTNTDITRKQKLKKIKSMRSFKRTPRFRGTEEFSTKGDITVISTGKEEVEEIDGIKFITFETESDMFEYSLLESRKSQKSKNFKRAYRKHNKERKIVITKTNDVTLIKGWRNKVFENNAKKKNKTVFNTTLSVNNSDCKNKSQCINNVDLKNESHYTAIVEPKIKACVDDVYKNKSSCSNDVHKNESKCANFSSWEEKNTSSVEPEPTSASEELLSSVNYVDDINEAFPEILSICYDDEHPLLKKINATYKFVLEHDEVHTKMVGEVNKNNDDSIFVSSSVNGYLKNNHPFNIPATFPLSQTNATDIFHSINPSKEEEIIYLSSDSETEEMECLEVQNSSSEFSLLPVCRSQKKTGKFITFKGKPLPIDSHVNSKMKVSSLPTSESGQSFDTIDLTDSACLLPQAKGKTEFHKLIKNVSQYNPTRTPNNAQLFSLNTCTTGNIEKTMSIDYGVHGSNKMYLMLPCASKSDCDHTSCFAKSKLKKFSLGMVLNVGYKRPMMKEIVENLELLKKGPTTVDGLWASIAASALYTPETKTSPVSRILVPVVSNSLIQMAKSSFNYSSNGAKHIEANVKQIVDDLVDYVVKKEYFEALDFPHDPRVSHLSTEKKLPPRKNKPKSKVERELMRLINVTLVDKSNSSNDHYNEGQCEKEYCAKGCICDSLNGKVSVLHCGKEKCMFQCSCRFKKNYLNSDYTSQYGNLAKEESTWHQTVICKNNDIIEIQAETGKSKREKKLPSRFRNNAVILGPEMHCLDSSFSNRRNVIVNLKGSANKSSRKETSKISHKKIESSFNKTDLTTKNKDTNLVTDSPSNANNSINNSYQSVNECLSNTENSINISNQSVTESFANDASNYLNQLIMENDTASKENACIDNEDTIDDAYNNASNSAPFENLSSRATECDISQDIELDDELDIINTNPIVQFSTSRQKSLDFCKNSAYIWCTIHSCYGCGCCANIYSSKNTALGRRDSLHSENLSINGVADLFCSSLESFSYHVFDRNIHSARTYGSIYNYNLRNKSPIFKAKRKTEIAENILSYTNSLVRIETSCPKQKNIPGSKEFSISTDCKKIELSENIESLLPRRKKAPFDVDLFKNIKHNKVNFDLKCSLAKRCKLSDDDESQLMSSTSIKAQSILNVPKITVFDPKQHEQIPCSKRRYRIGPAHFNAGGRYRGICYTQKVKSEPLKTLNQEMPDLSPVAATEKSACCTQKVRSEPLKPLNEEIPDLSTIEKPVKSGCYTQKVKSKILKPLNQEISDLSTIGAPVKSVDSCESLASTDCFMNHEFITLFESEIPESHLTLENGESKSLSSMKEMETLTPEYGLLCLTNGFGYLPVKYISAKKFYVQDPIDSGKFHGFKSIQNANAWLNYFFKSRMIFLNNDIEFRWIIVKKGILSQLKPFDKSILYKKKVDLKGCLTDKYSYGVYKNNKTKTSAKRHFAINSTPNVDLNLQSNKRKAEISEAEQFLKRVKMDGCSEVVSRKSVLPSQAKQVIKPPSVQNCLLRSFSKLMGAVALSDKSEPKKTTLRVNHELNEDKSKGCFVPLFVTD